jgi:hypothetical protein
MIRQIHDVAGKGERLMLKSTVVLLTIGFSLAFAPHVSAQIPLNVEAQAAQGFAAPGNKQLANFLVIVTNPVTGVGVPNLTQSDFSITNHFAIPGQSCGFSGGIVVFNNPGGGAYQIQVKTHHINPNVNCIWAKGDYLAQVRVTSPQGTGQVPVKLSVQ